jgi:hypothetical protein
MRIAELRQAHTNYFSRHNMKFFGDKEYRILHSKGGEAYLVRRTDGWSDIFGQNPTEHWRINPINRIDLSIGNLIEQSFPSLQAVKQWVKEMPCG